MIKALIHPKKKYFYFQIFLFFNLIIPKFFFSNSLSYDMKEKSAGSIFIHVFDLGTLILFFAVVILHNLYIRRITSNTLFHLFIIFYAYSFISAFFISNDLISSLYFSIKGILISGISIYLISLLNLKSITEQLNILILITKIIFVYGFIASIISGYMRDGLSILIHGTTGGQYSLIGFIYVILLIYNRKINFKLLSTIFIILFCSLFMNSFSSLLCLLFALIFLGILKYKFKFIFFIFFLSLLFMTSLNNINLNEITFGNKTIDNILTGSGRFQVYEASWIIISEWKYSFWGIGLNAEHTMLSSFQNLIWSHTSHNSFFASVLGLGVIGLVLYISLFYITLKNMIYLPQNMKHLNIILIMIFIYGITDALYPGRAGLLTTYAIFLYQIIINIKITTLNYKGNNLET